MHPDITMRVAHERAQDRLRAAESERAARALRRDTRHPAADADVALRLDRATDEAAVGRLAELNMRRLPDGPFVVGLTTTAENLVQIRRSRMRVMGETHETDYVDVEQVRREIIDARKLFAKMGWPVIDVSRRSIEETSAEIISLYNESRESPAVPDADAGKG